MKVICTLFVICISLTQTIAQNYSVVELTETNPEFPADVYSFPILKGPNESIVFKINTHLIKEQLEMEYGKQSMSIFENVWRQKDEPVARLNDITYKIELLNEKIYSTSISAEFCGAYCEGYELTYNYDLRQGTPIKLTDLFTPEGEQLLLQNIEDFKKDKINAKIKELELNLQSSTLKAEEKESITEVKEFYQECNSKYSSTDFFRFIPTKNIITIVVDECSTHVNRNYDELGNFVLVLDISTIKNDLSDYGQSILLENKRKKPN